MRRSPGVEGQIDAAKSKLSLLSATKLARPGSRELKEQERELAAGVWSGLEGSSTLTEQFCPGRKVKLLEEKINSVLSMPALNSSMSWLTGGR